ncbi:MAG: ATP-dependent helicase [Lachnospiraceae bacterium]|nr:ATP-dependent helicase [Lachnospiraceae bacterium]
MNDVFRRLNAAQREAVLHKPGVPLFVSAGPGSGKTAVLTARILYLIEEQKVLPQEILVITFTKAAALSMQQRFHKLVSKVYPVNFGTFHACFYHILQESGQLRHWKLLNDSQKKRILSPILRKYLSDTNEAMAQEFVSAISYYKNTSDAETACTRLSQSYRQYFSAVFTEYEKARKQSHAFDFDDMVYECRKLLCDRKDLLVYWQKCFRHILVDEFQDINAMQYEVLKLLAGKDTCIFAVGDDDQAIYGFRGADPFCIKRLIEDYGAKMLALQINYRCCQQIIDAAQLVIEENKERIVKHSQIAFAKREETEPENAVSLREFQNREEQYRYLAARLRERGVEQCAVLFRTNVYMQGFAVRLFKEGIPYVMKEHGAGIYEHFIAKDIMAYLKLSCVGADEDTGMDRALWLKVINKPFRNIDREALGEDKVSIRSMLAYYKAYDAAYDADCAREALKKLSYHLRALCRMELYLGIRYICKAMGYEHYLHKLAAQDQSKAEEWEWICDWLAADARQYATLKEWEEAQRRVTNGANHSVEKGAACEYQPVELLTAHGAKGLEFDRVWIPDCNEKIYPHGSMPDDKTCEEERRLLYVAMTRAKKSLELLYLTGTRERPRLPSRFLNPLLIRLQARRTRSCPDTHQMHLPPFHTPHHPE